MSLPDLSYVTTAADISPRVREALEELCIDTLSVVRAMLEHGTTEDRVMVAKALMPQMKTLLAPDQSTAAIDTRSEVMEYMREIADGWRQVTGSSVDDVPRDDSVAG